MTLRHALTGKQVKWKAGDVIERLPQRAHLTRCTKSVCVKPNSTSIFQIHAHARKDFTPCVPHKHA
jgi:hypothetical protein